MICVLAFAYFALSLLCWLLRLCTGSVWRDSLEEGAMARVVDSNLHGTSIANKSFSAPLTLPTGESGLHTFTLSKIAGECSDATTLSSP